MSLSVTSTNDYDEEAHLDEAASEGRLLSAFNEDGTVKTPPGRSPSAVSQAIDASDPAIVALVERLVAAEFAQADQDRERLLERLSAAEARYDERAAAISELEERVAALKNAVDDANESRDEATKRYERAVERLERLEDSVSTAAATKEGVNEALERLAEVKGALALEREERALYLESLAQHVDRLAAAAAPPIPALGVPFRDDDDFLAGAHPRAATPAPTTSGESQPSTVSIAWVFE